MNSELYLDLVSKTIITMLSKEIAVDVGAQIGARINELLNNTLAGLISEKIAAQTERLGRSILEIEDTLRPQLDGLGKEITGLSGRLAENPALTGELEAVKDSIARGLQSQKDVLAEVLSVKEGIPALTGTITGSMGNLSRQMAAIGDATRVLVENAGSDTLKQAIDGLQRQAEEAAKSSGAIKKDLSAINESVKKHLGKQLEGIASKIEASFADMDKRISNIADSTAKLAGETNPDIVKQVIDGLGRQAEEAAAASGAIKSDLKAINDTLKDNSNGQAEGIAEKIDASFADIGDRISNISEGLSRQIAVAADAGANTGHMVREAIDGGFKDMREAIRHLSSEEERTRHIDSMAKKVGDSLRVIEKDIAFAAETSRIMISGKLDEIEGTVSGIIETQVKREKSIMTVFSEDMASIKQTLQMREKDEGEMVKGVYYSMKKLTNDFNKEKENVVVFNKQYLTSMSDLKKHIEDDLGKRLKAAEELNTSLKNDIQNLNQTLQHSVKEQNKLLIDIIGTLEKQLPFFSGKFDEALSGIDTKITGFERAAKLQITGAGTDFMKFIDENVVNNLKDLEKSYGSLKGEISSVRQLANSNVKDQADVLQGVFLSVKKLLNIATKERDDSEKVTRELANALDNLYSHIRRLESEKDELDVELLRLAGDDYFKNKFKMLENELAKSHHLIEKYQEEKRELEQKYLRLQDEWNETRDTGGE